MLSAFKLIITQRTNQPSTEPYTQILKKIVPEEGEDSSQSHQNQLLDPLQPVHSKKPFSQHSL
jgi:hypothetical protein